MESKSPTVMLNHAFDAQRHDADELVLLLDRSDVESGNVASLLNVLLGLSDTDESVRNWQGKLRLVVHGWEDDERELFEVPQVVNFVRAVDVHWSYWMHFFAADHAGLGLIMLMLLDLDTQKAGERVVSHIRDRAQVVSVMQRMSSATAALHIASGLSSIQSKQVVDKAMNSLERLFGR